MFFAENLIAPTPAAACQRQLWNRKFRSAAHKTACSINWAQRTKNLLDNKERNIRAENQPEPGEWKWSKVECLCVPRKAALCCLLLTSRCFSRADCINCRQAVVEEQTSWGLAPASMQQIASCLSIWLCIFESQFPWPASGSARRPAGSSMQTQFHCVYRHFTQCVSNARTISGARSISSFFLRIIAFDIHFQHTWVCRCIQTYMCDSCQRLTQAFAYNIAINSIANSSLPHPFCAIYW